MNTLEKLEELIYKGFKETDERLAEHRRELDEQRKKERRELDEQRKKERRELDEQLKKERQETERRWRETDEQLKKERRESDERIEKERQKTERQWRETDKRIERLHQEIGGVTDSLSRFSEQTVFPATKHLFAKRGIELNRLYANFETHLNGDNMETDVIGLGPECSVLIEVKLRLRQADVEEFLEKKLPRFFDFFPSFRQPVLYGGVAGLSIDKGVDRFAYRKGLFVISQTGDNLRILNDKKFKPRSFAAPEDNRFPRRATK